MELNKLVEKAQAKDPDAILELLTRYGYSEDYEFTNFLGKYVKLLWYGRMDFRNKDSRKFMRLYIKDPEIRRRLIWPRVSGEVVEETWKMVNYLQNYVTQNYTLMELQHELVSIFLELLDRYEKVYHIDFSGYLMGMYRYKVYERLQKYLYKYDVLSQQTRLTSPEQDIPYIEPGYLRIENDFFKYDDELNLFWVHGETGRLFKNLSTLDRIIIRDSYDQNKSDFEIADSQGVHRNTIVNKRRRFKERLYWNIKKETDWD